VRWPGTAKAATALALNPVVNDASPADRKLCAVQLATDDASLLRGLFSLVAEQLAQPPQPGWAADAQQLWQRMLPAVQQAQRWAAQPMPMLRFNQAVLEAESVQPTRAVLALKLSGLLLRQQRFSELHFHLQAVPQGGELGGPVYFIFYKSPALQGWRATTQDATKRPVMALSLTSTGWDASTYAGLPEADHALLNALVDVLPVVVVSLQAEGAALKSGWKAWSQLAQQVRQWPHMAAAWPAADPAPAPAPKPRSKKTKFAPAPAVVPEAVTVVEPPPTAAPRRRRSSKS
jgi:hypothetical protein